jgi:hypothetical protein
MSTAPAATASPNYADLVSKLQARDAELGSILDVPNVLREQQKFWTEKTALASAISALQNLPDDVARAERALAEWQGRLERVAAKEAELTALIGDAPDPETIVDVREREREVERQRQLRRQLELLREGSLWAAPGAVFEPREVLQRIINEKADRLQRLRLALDGALAAAEALLGAG